MSEKKKLHPISAVASFLKQLKELIIPFIFLIFLNRGESSSGNFFIDNLPFFAIVVTLVFVLAFGIIKWLRFTYWIENDELRIEYGLWVKKKRYIPFDRIQSLNSTESIIHRPFGLVKIKVETAGASDKSQAEAELTAISLEDAKELQEIIYNAKKQRNSEKVGNSSKLEHEDKQQEEVIYQMSFKDLILMAVTSGGIGVVIGGAMLFLSQFNEIIPYELVFKELEEFVRSGVLIVSVVVLLGLLLAYGLAIFGTILVNANFTVKKIDTDIIITRGLLEKKQTTIPLNRIQGIRILENLIRQPLGYATVQIESAGGSVLDKDSTDIKLLPMVKKKEIENILSTILPQYNLDLDYETVPKRALKRYLFRHCLVVLPVVIALPIIFWPIGLYSLLLLVPALLIGYGKYLAAGWNINDHQLAVRYRNIVKHTVYMKKNRIQSLEVTESWFQTKKDLATLRVTIKSGVGGAVGKVVDLETEAINEVYHWYQPDHHSTGTRIHFHKGDDGPIMDEF
ncbi:putative membrane protein [Bacillus pakistanensis]|uniref:Membrane protein n=1 Tax=Rossellomorea pakistanensis TaxID=992288 RepID=A0ABS2NKH9_9BACI|nr:PH domain-containing protein [Bacillus pakistanensis]MBM7588026.1 putative membrane protein [Bacillus pakistanensis]